MKILAVDTSCDETSAAVTDGIQVLSNIIWSQASLHAKWGGVLPSLAQREHEKRIDWVIEKALRQAQCKPVDIEAVAVTVGPGLAIALEVGIRKARELAHEWNKPLIPINHIEGHLLSPLAKSKSKLSGAKDVHFPALGLVVSGGHTELVYILKIGEYKILAETQDDALGEALDKAARMLGLGYPGGAFLEKLAREGKPLTGSGQAYPLPLPMAGREDQNSFSYSGLKSAMYRLVEKIEIKNKQQTCDLAASFQDMAFRHLVRVMKRTMENNYSMRDLLVGGGVAANMELRKRLRGFGKELNIKVWFPDSKRLIGDNAAMIGVAAGLRQSNVNNGHLLVDSYLIDKIDREPRARVDKPFSWQV